MTHPQGLCYYPNIIPKSMIKDLKDALDDADWFPVPGHGGVVSENSRRVAHFGFTYDYRAGKVSNPAPDFPDVLVALRDLIPTEELGITQPFNQCIVNRYLPSQGISSHYDREEYGEFIACFTFGSGAEMEFTRVNDVYTLYTQPLSLYIMSGESRHEWYHQMRGRLTDVVDGRRISRGVRYSFTFRHVPT